MTVRKAVVLPAPLRPRSIVSPARGTSKSTPCRMWYWPMCVLTPASASSGSGIAGTSLCDAEIGLLHDRRGDHRVGLAVGDQFALVQHDDAVGERAHDVHLVLDQQDRLVALRL